MLAQARPLGVAQRAKVHAVNHHPALGRSRKSA